MNGRRFGSMLAAATLLVSGLGSAAAAAPAKAPRPATLHWRACANGFQCSRLAVPLDDTVAHSPTISLALARLPASDPSHRIGSLLVNPGGPGASAVQYVVDSAASLPKAIRARFDIVGFDPRGSGGSAPVVCDTHLDPFYNLDFTPHDDATRQALVAGVRAYVATCQAHAGAELPYVSTERSARDMERIRAALGDSRITYLGYSYGTYLGALYADLYPHKIRAMVFDGAVDPTLSASAGQVLQAEGFEHALDLFLQACATDNSCSFQHGGNPGAAYDALRARVGATPLPADGAGKGRKLNGTQFDIGVSQFLYSGKAAWSDFGKALDAADRGDGSLLLESSDQYTARSPDGTYASGATDAFLAIGCLDGPDVGGLAGMRAIEDQAGIVAPRLGRSVVNNSLACAVWPVPTQTAAVPHAVGAPPILVIGNTDDPATPLSGAKDLAGTLQSGLLLTVKSAQHTAYASGNACVDTAVDGYLLQRVPPAPGTQC